METFTCFMYITLTCSLATLSLAQHAAGGSTLRHPKLRLVRRGPHCFEAMGAHCPSVEGPRVAAASHWIKDQDSFGKSTFEDAADAKHSPFDSRSEHQKSVAVLPLTPTVNEISTPVSDSIRGDLGQRHSLTERQNNPHVLPKKYRCGMQGKTRQTDDYLLQGTALPRKIYSCALRQQAALRGDGISDPPPLPPRWCTDGPSQQVPHPAPAGSSNLHVRPKSHFRGPRHRVPLLEHGNPSDSAPFLPGVPATSRCIAHQHADTTEPAEPRSVPLPPRGRTRQQLQERDVQPVHPDAPVRERGNRATPGSRPNETRGHEAGRTTGFLASANRRVQAVTNRMTNVLEALRKRLRFPREPRESQLTSAFAFDWLGTWLPLDPENLELIREPATGPGYVLVLYSDATTRAQYRTRADFALKAEIDRLKHESLPEALAKAEELARRDQAQKKGVLIGAWAGETVCLERRGALAQKCPSCGIDFSARYTPSGLIYSVCTPDSAFLHGWLLDCPHLSSAGSPMCHRAAEAKHCDSYSLTLPVSNTCTQTCQDGVAAVDHTPVPAPSVSVLQPLRNRDHSPTHAICCTQSVSCCLKTFLHVDSSYRCRDLAAHVYARPDVHLTKSVPGGRLQHRVPRVLPTLTVIIHAYPSCGHEYAETANKTKKTLNHVVSASVSSH